MAPPADPLDLEGRAQAVVAADVVAAHEGAVGRDATRIADAPFGIDLELARTLQIVEELVGRGRRRSDQGNDRATGGFAVATERSEIGEREEFGLRHGRRSGVEDSKE